MDEFDLIKKYVPTPSSDEFLVLGKGDDCSVVNFDDDHYLVQTTDNFVEGVHFRMERMSAQETAYKSLAVNISDILAMGAVPRWCHLSLAVPSSIKEGWLEEFFESFNKTSQKENVKLVGGDLSKSPKTLFINVHVSGLVKKTEMKLRSKLGEPSKLLVTGVLGDSSAGFYAMENNLNEEPLVKKHKHPSILSEEARWLACRKEVLGMMDLSDGLVSDLKRIPQGVIKIQTKNIPHSNELQRFCENNGREILEFSLAGGEDYELLLSCEIEEVESLKKDFQDKFGKSLFEIGEVISGANKVVYLEGHEPKNFKFTSFTHFNGP